MDTLGINQLVEELIKDYETAETHGILFYSSDKGRDYELLSKKVKEYRQRLNALLTPNDKAINISETGNSLREEDLSKELL